ncbi:Sec14p-like phosphatidylinositol transfer family protein isoform 3 [Theobroma cacao]|uniref:Sec14p-like phosphatidylinositol transfer family protein isoform 3 n=1 Tax=Theobroma cacao TaxID=3641 RepID=A0A061F008_THECC|nr:Sec14p-like phosphatidylinositol transfer family protein isoform 3 [Theobroma cacao]
MSLHQLKGSAKDKSLLPEEQQAKIDDVRKLIGPIADKLPVLCSDASISRYLRARNWSTKKASKMLKETLKWRLQYKPEKIRWEDIAHEAETGKIYRANYCDKLGRPVLVMRPGFQNTNSTSGQIKYLVYCMENAIMNLTQDQEQMVWLVDFQRWVKPFLEPKTYKKVKFVYSDDPKSQKIIEEVFDLDKLDVAFGGRNTAGFDYQAYAQQMKEDDIKKSNVLDSSCTSPPYPSSVLSKSHQLESLDLDHYSNASDKVGLLSGDEATPSNLEHIDEKTRKLSLGCKDVAVGEAAIAKQVQ